MLNVWVIFTFVAIWHDLEWYHALLNIVVFLLLCGVGFILSVVYRKLVSWAWLTCLFMIPEIIIKSTFTAFKVRSFKSFFRLSA